MTRIRRFLTGLWPTRLMGQTVLLILIALFSAQIISALIIRSEAQDFYRGAESRFIAVRIAPIAVLMNDMPADQQDRIAGALSNRRLHVWMSDTPVVDRDDDDRDDERENGHDDDDHDDDHGRKSLASLITSELGDDIKGPVHVFRLRKDDDDHHEHGMPAHMRAAMQNSGMPGGPDAFRHDATVVSIGIAPGRWMNAALQSRPPQRLIRPDAWITFFITAVVISIMVIIALLRITRPLDALSGAARKLGRGEEVAPVPEEGPADVRDAIRTFNEMQHRLRTFVNERTKMLASISHDLRTPITSLRLRAEMLDERDTAESMIATLNDMQAMIEATLAFAREEQSGEPTRPTDLGGLLDAIADDLVTLGHQVEVDAGESVTCPCRALALRRALSNLIENAAIYGHQARVGLRMQNGAPEITIEDDGPGIPAGEMERIFEPFVRLDPSRNAETGGTGLGMSIARDIIRRHGGDIALANREGGGLRVTVCLPAAGNEN